MDKRIQNIEHVELPRDIERLRQLEKMAYRMTDSARPKPESRRVAKLAAKEALRVMRAEVEAYEALNRG